MQERSRIGLSLRRWITYVPPQYDHISPRAVVVFLHGDHQPYRAAVQGSGFLAQADKHGFVVVAPDDGPKYTWVDPDDHADVTDIVEFTLANYCVDPDRVYLVGNAQGTRGVEHLICDGWARAVGLHAYDLDRNQLFCPAPAAIPTLIIQGSNSPRIPLAGGRECSGKTQASRWIDLRARWGERNDCDLDDKYKRVWHGDETRCRDFECQIPFRTCLHDGGFLWPGMPFDPTDQACHGPVTEFDLAAEFWRFFDTQTP